MIKLAVANIPALVCYAAAIYLSANDLDGWGWFLFVGAMVTHTARTKKENEDD